MLVYNPSQSIHPWSRQQEHDCGHAGTLSQDTGYGSSMVADSGLDNSAYAMSTLGQFTSAGTDMLQASLLLQPQTHAPLAQVLAGSLNLAQVPSPPVLSQPPTNLHAAPSPAQLMPISNLGSSQQQGCRVFVPESLTSAASPASLLPATADLQMVNDSTNSLPLLQEQLVAQALQQQQHLTMTPAQPHMHAALAAAMCAGAGTQQSLPLQPVTLALPMSSPPTFPYQAGVADAAATSAAAAMAAALLVQQQQQPATAAAPASGTVPGISSNPLLQQLLISQQAVQHTAGAPVSMNMINQLLPWAVKALTTQLQQLSSNLNQAAFNQQQMALATLVGSTPATCAGQRPTSTSTLHGRRPRNARRSSGCVVAGCDMAGASSSYTVASRACSSAGSDFSLALDGRPGSSVPAVLPEGISLEDLCTTTYQDNWGALDCKAAPTTNSRSSDIDTTGPLHRSESCQLSPGSSADHSSSSMASSSTLSDGAASSCSSTSSLGSSKRDESGAAGLDKWQWDSHFCSLESGAAACTSGIVGRVRRPSATRSSDEAQAAQDDTRSSPDQDAHTTCQHRGVPAGGKAAGCCAVWVPGPREVAGDDSWYLPRPPTCRLFVGNIGCWVDEAMLLAYFGKYGHVVDVQVMWNTKMLARGRRVNREFAFISYSNPLEAARAVHWLDGCRLPDLEKDKNGVTVEYENGEGDSLSGKA